MTYIHVG